MLPRELILLVLVIGHVAAAQPTKQAHEHLTQQTKERVAILQKQLLDLNNFTPLEKELQARCAKNCSDPELQAQMESDARQKKQAGQELVSQILDLLDQFITQTVSPRIGEQEYKRLTVNLKTVLGENANDLVSPAAFILDSPQQCSLIVVYAVSSSAAVGSVTTIRAFTAAGNRLRLTAVTGGDMDSYGNLSVKKLPSPTPDGFWLLIWGQAEGANGPNIGMRIYEYRAEKFKPVWMPANEWGNFEVTVTKDGFNVDGAYYREDRQRHDRYRLTEYGLYLKQRNE
jgi:hypothetical protein